MSVVENHPEISPSTSPCGSNRPSNAIVHAKCGQWWTGTRTSHCSGCCRTFAGLAAFDAHRDGNHARGERHCVDPETVGLVDSGRAYPCWGHPSDGTQWWKSADGSDSMDGAE